MSTTQTAPPPDRLLSWSQMARRCGVNERTLRRQMEAGTFPKPDYRIGSDCPRWRESTFVAWLETQTA
jgi:predicted DNA-binding transcriptional regulator AlpA